MAQTLGIIDVVWKGTKYPADDGTGSFDMGGLQNASVVAGRQVHRAQKMTAAKAEITTPLMAGMSLTDVFDRTSGELQVNCDTGQQFIINDAFLVVTPNATAGGGGKVKLSWEGSEALEIS